MIPIHPTVGVVFVTYADSIGLISIDGPRMHMYAPRGVPSGGPLKNAKKLELIIQKEHALAAVLSVRRKRHATEKRTIPPTSFVVPTVNLSNSTGCPTCVGCIQMRLLCI